MPEISSAVDNSAAPQIKQLQQEKVVGNGGPHQSPRRPLAVRRVANPSLDFGT